MPTLPGDESTAEKSPETSASDSDVACDGAREQPAAAELPSAGVKPDRVRRLLGRWWTQENVGVTKEFIGLIAAALAVVAAVLGYLLTTKAEEADSLRSDNLQLQSHIGILREQVAGLEGTNTELRNANAKADQEIAQLRAQLPEVAPVGSDIPPIRKASTLTLAADGDSIELNSTTLNFGATPATIFEPDVLRYSSDGLMFGFGGFGGGTVSRVRLSEPASYGPCSIASGWAPVSEWYPVDPSEFSDGQTCLRLASGRIATIKPTAIGSGAVTLRITVWQLP